MKRLFTIICLLCLAIICLTACKHEHTIVTDTAVAPTCSAEGKTEGSHCSVCNEVIVAQEVMAKLEHTAVTDEAVEATCTAEGLSEGSHCSVCGEVITAQEVVAKLEHTAVTDEAVEATCTAEGMSEGTHCSVCGEIITAQEVVAKGEHTVVIIEATEPRCAHDGNTEGSYCSVCGTVFKQMESIPGFPHVEATIPGVPATCISEGKSDIVYCTVCGIAKPTLGTGEEKGLTLKNIITKDTSILQDMTYLGDNVWIIADGNDNRLIHHNAKVYKGSTDVFGLTCDVYAVLYNGAISNIYCIYEAEGVQYAGPPNLLSVDVAKKCALSNSNAVMSFLDTLKDYTDCSYSAFAVTPYIYDEDIPITEAQIYELTYLNYPTGDHARDDYDFRISGSCTVNGTEVSFEIKSGMESYGKNWYFGRIVYLHF